MRALYRCVAGWRAADSIGELTDDLQEAEVTVQVCWDADRLDLGRVGHVPDPGRLCTPAARCAKLIDWAYTRSTRGWR